MANKTFISIEFWQLVGFLLSFLGVCWGFGKMLLAQFQAQQEERQKQQARLHEKVEQLENQFAEQKHCCRKNTCCATTTSATRPYSKPRWIASKKTLTDLYKMESQKK